MGHTKEQLLSLLQELKIEFSQFEHPVVLTVEEQAKYIGHMNGALTKNLFLKDKKQRFYIVSALAETKVDLKVLSQRLGLGKGGLRMAPEETFAEIIQVPLGCVTPFSLVNESARNVSLLLDQRLKTQEYCFFHPLSNDMSIALNSHDLDKFLNSIGKPLAYVDLEADTTVGKDQPPDLAGFVPPDATVLPDPPESKASSQSPEKIPVSGSNKPTVVTAVKSSYASAKEKSRAAANSPIAFADPDKFVEEILEKTVSTALSVIKQHIEKDQKQLSITISNHLRKQLDAQLKIVSNSQYFFQTPSHGIYPLQSSGIQSNESRRASFDASDSDNGTETPSSIPNSQFLPFSSQIELEKITLNQATETGHESDGDHGKRTVWTVEDDKLLAAAYTIISEDPRVGNGQKGESFWKRIVAYYNSNRDKGAKKRTAEKAKTHWAAVKKIVNRYNGIYNKWYSDRPSGWSDEDLMMQSRETYKSTYHTAFQYEHVWMIVKDSPMYAPQSSGHRAAKKARISESSEAHTDLSNTNTTVNVGDSETRSPPMGQKATKRKDKEKVTQIEEANQILQQSLALLNEYYKNKKVEQLIQAHQLLVMDTRYMSDEQLHNHRAICEQIKKILNM